MPVRQGELLRGDALISEELGYLVGSVLLSDRDCDLPENQVAEYPAVIFCRVRRRLQDHLAAGPGPGLGW